MATTVTKISKSQFVALYNDSTLFSQDIAEKLNIPYAELSRMAKACGMSLRNRAKGKRKIYLFDEEETITNDVVETVVTPVEVVQHEVRASNVVDMFNTIED